MECDMCPRPALIRQGELVLCAVCYATKMRHACLRRVDKAHLSESEKAVFTRRAKD